MYICILYALYLQFHFYADDTTLPRVQAETVSNCISGNKSGMATHFPKLNDDQTELLILCSI